MREDTADFKELTGGNINQDTSYLLFLVYRYNKS